MSNLVLFTNRSGSTILTDLLAYSQGTLNLGEGTHSVVREYNYNTNEQKQSKLYKNFVTNLTAKYHNMETKGFDHIGFFQAKQERIDILKNTNESWTVKENLEKQTIDVPFIQYCISNNIDVYMTHRRDVVQQFISKINARYRMEILRTDGNQFIYTNHDQHFKYDVMKVPFHWLHLYTNIFIGQLFMWRTIYELFKPHVNVVSYEDNIKPFKLTKFGITQDHIDHYKKETVHLVPTPYNTDKLVVTDDLPVHCNRAWDQSLYYVEKHKYLVDIS